MKFLSVVFVFLLNSFFLFSQTLNIPVPKLSAGARQYLWKLDNEQTERPYVFPGYVYRTDAEDKVYISTIIKVQPEFNQQPLDDLGVRINTKAGNIWTAQVPVEKIKDFMLVSGILYIETDQPAVPLMDAARTTTKVDSVHGGYDLPLPYSGKNVVMGIIDAGYDYTHPALYDTVCQTYRVKRVWEEKTAGIPPSGFFYGNEYADSAAILARGHDITDGSHGIHVAGIAAGSGYGSDAAGALFRGVAYNSDLALVAIYPALDYWLTTGMADMIDGINYVFQYAESVGKPAVANLSWGCPLGPRDGNSLFSQALDNLTGAGKIFVISAGNNGNNRIHFQKTFVPADTITHTFLTFSTLLPERLNRVDVWGEEGERFCMQFSLYNGTSKISNSAFICTDNDATYPLTLVGSDGDTCFIALTVSASEFNNKPHILLDIKSRTANRLCLTLSANNGTVNMWQGYVLKTSGYYGTFVKLNYNWAENGDSEMTVSDMVTSHSAIGVGAYSSKTSFTNISGQNLSYTGYTEGTLAAFSSHGPTADGRVKPNITAPGMAVASAVNAADTALHAGGLEYDIVLSEFVSPVNGQTYSYALFPGTSMSAPVVSGIVALMLEINPHLTPERVMDILTQTAIVDSFTGTIPAEGNNSWGVGKVNAYEAVKKTLETAGIFHEKSTLQCLVYPNPNTGIYSVQYTSTKPETVLLKVYDNTGKALLHEQRQAAAGTNTFQLDLSAYSAGVYFTEISTSHQTARIKIIKQ